jgi:hypothetical protein
MIEFPRALLRERSHSWNLVGVAATPGVSAKSVATFVRSDGGGFWSCVMSDVALSGGPGLVGRDRQKISTLLWRAVRQLCDGGVNAIVVPRNDALFIPFPRGLTRGGGLVPHSDAAPFGDGSEYYQSTIDIKSDGAAALRATTMTISLNVSSTLQGGEAFSILHPAMGWRMYEIAAVEHSDDETTAMISFLPPLREAIGDATELEFERPRCTMRLAQPGSMDLAAVPWTFNQASVDFVEAFP